MNLTKKTWHYNFWKLNYGYSNWSKQEPNNNFCDYFWALVWALCMLPVTWIGLLIKYFTDDDVSSMKDSFTITLLTYVGIFLVTMFIIATFKFKSAFLLPILFVVGGGIALFAITYYFVEVYPETDFANNISESKDIVKESWKSFKGKYFPQIKWN